MKIALEDYENWKQSFFDRRICTDTYLEEITSNKALIAVPKVIEILEELTFDAEPNMILKSGIAQALEELRKVYEL